MVKFASSLKPKELSRRIKALRGNGCLKAIEERNLLLKERKYRRLHPQKKIKKIPYPCDDCADDCPLKNGISCEKLNDWHELPSKHKYLHYVKIGKIEWISLDLRYWIW